MKLKFPLLLFVFLIFSNCFAANETKISGNFPNAHGRILRILAYNDLITNEKIEIAKTIVNQKDNFEVKLNLKSITYIFIQLEFFKVQMYVEPNKSYILQFDTVDVSNPKFYPVGVVGYLSPKFKIVGATQRELNSELEILDKIYGDFVDENHLSLIRGLKIDSLSKVFNPTLDSLYNLSSNQFVKDAIKLQIYRFQLLTHQISKDSISKILYSNSKLFQYSNKPWMDYFVNFWSDVLINPSKKYKVSEIDSVINKKMSFVELSHLLKKENKFQDSILRELVILSNLSQIHNSKYKAEAINNILVDISMISKIPEHRKIAIDLLLARKKMQNGQRTPDFKITDLKGESYTNTQLEGKFTYIYFWSTRNSESLAELEFIKQKTFDEFDDIINFITISLDADSLIAQNYVKSRGYKWIIAHYNHDFPFIENLNIEIIPSAILLDKTGKIENNNVLLPSHGFTEYFLKMLNDKKGNLKRQ